MMGVSSQALHHCKATYAFHAVACDCFENYLELIAAQDFCYDGREHHCISGPHIIHIFSMSKARPVSAQTP